MSEQKQNGEIVTRDPKLYYAMVNHFVRKMHLKWHTKHKLKIFVENFSTNSNRMKEKNKVA